jgi:hypothetical protein
MMRALEGVDTWTRDKTGYFRDSPERWLGYFPAEVRPVVLDVVRHAPFKMAPLRQWATENYPEIRDVNVDKGWLMWYIVQAECARRSAELGARADEW